MKIVYGLIALFLSCFHSNLVYAQSTTKQLNNNQIVSASVAIHEYNYYYFSVPTTNQLFSKRDLPTIHLSTTICNQPTAPADSHDTVPPLNLYVSTSISNTLPGPDNSVAVNDSSYGLIKWTSNNQTSEIWIAVAAPALTGSWVGNYTYEIGVSTSQTMHPIFINNEKKDNANIPYVILDDTDRNNALFLSSPIQSSLQNLTLLVTSGMPVELSHSLCAAKQRTLPLYNVNTTTTHRGPTNGIRQQFMVSNLTQDTSYTAYMLQPVRSVTGMTTPINFGTKIDANCRIIYDLSFCDQVAYSVPTGLDSFVSNDLWALARLYDAQAQEKFGPFDTALSQYNCETTQYSLVRNCTDCYRDYKTWLCAVTIPRCTDSSASADFSQGTDEIRVAPALRDISANASRNPWIDESLKPGEWTELLPCIDLCYHVVQSCPPFMQFYCPNSDLALVQYGFWQNGTVSINGTSFHFDINNPTCNRMGVDPILLTIGSGNQLYSPNLLMIACIVSVLLFAL
ncbi:stretch-activated Ca2+-permeable channel component-domain-containing protein [Parasitella parasitica]|nr:stretch-activated Ca2+-permeable channel component-domain-containing protein [Parasitella parasitica]